MTRLVPMTEERAKRLRRLAQEHDDAVEVAQLPFDPESDLLRSFADAYEEGLDAADAIATLEAAYFDGLPDALYDTEGIIQRLRSLLPEETSDGS